MLALAQKKVISTLCILAIGLLSLSHNYPAHSDASLCYRILPESKLFLEGETNVSDFECICTGVDNFPPLFLEVEPINDNSQFIFDDARLDIKTKNLDCGHKVMNSDLYDALQAHKHPFISIELEKASLFTKATHLHNNQWALASSKAILTIAGTSRPINLRVNTCKLDNNTYRFISKYAVNMTDFGIAPPTAMLGMIKVKNQIVINFDLHVEVE